MTDSARDHLPRTPQTGARNDRRERYWRGLIQQIAQRNPQALAHLYDATNFLVHGLIFRILGNATMAEEVTNEVYMQVWRQAAKYDPERAPPSVWLFMLARSRALDRLRGLAQDQRRTEALEATPGASTTGTPAEPSVVTEQRHLVQVAFASLTPEQRTVIELAYFAGCSHSEIARRLGQPLGTVKARVRSAMIKIRETLQPLVE